MNKRKLALFLAIALILSLFPQLTPPAYAEAAYSGTCGSNLNWRYDPDTRTLTIEGSGAMWNYVGADSVPWYDYRWKITTVSLPEGLTSIGNYAFRGCSALTSVTIPDSVSSIGPIAFYGCCSLTSVTIPDSVTSIGFATFHRCSALTSVTIGNGVTSIGENAFDGCSSLTSITIPDSVKSIGRYAFDGCYALTEFNVASGNLHYSSLDGVLFNKYKTELIKYPASKPETSYLIPDNVTNIGESAFVKCSLLTDVTIPDSVTGIGLQAFACCSALKSVIIGNSSTFNGCSTGFFCMHRSMRTIHFYFPLFF